MASGYQTVTVLRATLTLLCLKEQIKDYLTFQSEINCHKYLKLFHSARFASFFTVKNLYKCKNIDKYKYTRTLNKLTATKQSPYAEQRSAYRI